MSMLMDRTPRLEELEREFDHPPAETGIPDGPMPRRHQRWTEATLPLSWARGLALAWLLIGGSLIAFEPAPQDPNAPIPLLASALVTGFLVSLSVTMVGLGRRRLWAPIPSLIAGLSALAVGVGCLGTEHHAMPYPLLEIAGFGALTWLSWKAMRVAGAGRG